MSRLSRIVLVVVLLSALLCEGGVATSQPLALASEAAQEVAVWQGPCPSGDCEFVRGRVLVKLAPEIRMRSPALQGGWTQSTDVNQALAAQNILRLDRILPGVSEAGRLPLDGRQPDVARWYRALLQDSEADVQAVVEALNRVPGVEYAEPDYIGRPGAAPNDPRYAEQWALSKIQIEGAWAVVTGSPAVVIAMVDSGIDLDHPDLSPNLWSNPGEIAGNGVDDDGNGYVDDLRGWNFVSGTSDVWDDNGHGTLVAGIAAARTDNGVGIAGVCGNCRVMPVKVMQPSGAANYSDIATGIVYAADKGARVINLALGGYADSRAVRDAIDYAIAKNVVVVGGAGNDDTSAPFYPAAYDDVIAVAGTTNTDTRTAFTNYGSWVDVSAPGEGILTTALGGDYLTTSGTSMAAPSGAGLAGLLLTLHPDWTPAMVRLQLMQTADSIDHLNPGYEGKLGSGRLNAAQAVQPPVPILTYAGYGADGTANGRPDFGASVGLAVSVYNDWADAMNVNATLRTIDPYVTVVTGSAAYGDILSGQTVANTTPFSITIATGAGYNHAIPFTLDLTANNGGYATTLAFTVTTRGSIEQVSGTIGEDTVWTSDKTYLVVSNLGIAPGVTLTIQPGTTVKFDGDYALNVGGTLIADGTTGQPIVFESNSTGSTWSHIYFDDPSTDAVADDAGAYQSGTILHYVQVKDAANGLVCNDATPYLLHVTIDQGGINCACGSTRFWLLDSTVSGDVLATGGPGPTAQARTGRASPMAEPTVPASMVAPSTVRGTTISGGNLSLGAESHVLTSTVGGSISLGGGSTVQSSSVEGNVSISGDGTVVSNTVSGGGISLGGGSTVQGNNVEDASGTAIQTSGTVTVTANRVVGSAGAGIVVSSGLVQGNLIANCGGDGLQVGAATVLGNTFTGIEGRALYTTGGVPVKIQGNNFEFNRGTHDLYNNNGAEWYVIAQGNWWGTTDTAAIAGRIYDFDDDYTKGRVSYTPVLTGPSTEAPAYVRSVTLTPGSPVGIETVAFEVEFSRQMDAGIDAEVAFFTTKCGTWTVYDKDNSGLPHKHVRSIAIDTDGAKWFGTDGGGLARFDGSTWTVYNPANSSLPDDEVYSIAIDTNGAKWFGTGGGGVARFDGSTWTIYQTGSGLPQDHVFAIAIDTDGAKWFGTGGGGVARFGGSTWTVYDTVNSGLPSDYVHAVALAADAAWFGTHDAGVARFDGSTWTVYNSGNSDLPTQGVLAIAVDLDGARWFATWDGVARLDGSTWTIYDTGNSGLPAAPCGPSSLTPMAGSGLAPRGASYASTVGPGPFTTRTTPPCQTTWCGTSRLRTTAPCGSAPLAAWVYCMVDRCTPSPETLNGRTPPSTALPMSSPRWSLATPTASPSLARWERTASRSRPTRPTPSPWTMPGPSPTPRRPMRPASSPGGTRPPLPSRLAGRPTTPIRPSPSTATPSAPRQAGRRWSTGPPPARLRWCARG